MAPKAETWIGWFGAVVVASITGTFVLLTFAYAQFETKEHAKERIELVQDQLSSMDQKLDRILGYDLLAPNRTPAKRGAQRQQ